MDPVGSSREIPPSPFHQSLKLKAKFSLQNNESFEGLGVTIANKAGLTLDIQFYEKTTQGGRFVSYEFFVEGEGLSRKTKECDPGATYYLKTGKKVTEKDVNRYREQQIERINNISPRMRDHHQDSLQRRSQEDFQKELNQIWGSEILILSLQELSEEEQKEPLA